ncbi:MAG: ABC transporter permease [Candidatus Tectomicrobia bacterium]|nr:ABC transporter permease [Candidatus Tectomicrobia bacterium]
MPVASVLAAFAVAGALLAATGVNPFRAYGYLFLHAFADRNSLAEILVRTAPLLLTGLGVAVAFQCGMWNIGAEGQLYVGAVAATGLGIGLVHLPAGLLLPLIVLASVAAGGLYGALPGWLKVRFGANEIIVTIMLNYVAILGSSYLLNNPWKEPSGLVPRSANIVPGAQLPRLVEGTRIHAGILLALAATAVLYVLLQKTILGYRLRAVGCNPQAAHYGGIPVGRTLIVGMALSGALAGLAGMGEISGVHHHLLDDFSPGYGFTGIIVALLGNLHPLGVVAAAALFAALQVGAESMQRTFRIATSMVWILQGLVVLFALGSRFLIRYIKEKE